MVLIYCLRSVVLIIISGMRRIYQHVAGFKHHECKAKSNHMSNHMYTPPYSDSVEIISDWNNTKTLHMLAKDRVINTIFYHVWLNLNKLRRKLSKFDKVTNLVKTPLPSSIHLQIEKNRKNQLSQNQTHINGYMYKIRHRKW